MLLSDRDIRDQIERGRVALEPFDDAMIQPSSIDFRLDRYFRVFENHRYPHIDPAEEQPELTRAVEPEGDEPFILHPGEFVLGSTYEVITLPDDVAARVEGKSSLGRLGLLTHATAGFIDPGFSGPRDARAVQRRHLAGQAVAGDEDRPVLLHPAVVASREPVRQRQVRLALPGPARPDPVAVVPELPPHQDLTSRGGHLLASRPALEAPREENSVVERRDL